MSRTWSLLGVDAPFDPELRWVTSWAMPPAVLGGIRLLLAVYTLVHLIVVVAWDSTVYHDGNTFLSYFTDLTFIGLCSWFWASSVQTLAYALGSKTSYPLQRWPRPLQFLHSLLFSTIATYPVIVTVVYWSILAGPQTFDNTFDTWSNISHHALNTVFMLFEVFLTNCGPQPWAHEAFILLILVLYLGLAYLTHDLDHIYVYSFLDPANGAASLAGYIVGIAVAGLLLFAIFPKGVCALKRRILRRKGLLVSDEKERGEKGDMVELQSRSNV